MPPEDRTNPRTGDRWDGLTRRTVLRGTGALASTALVGGTAGGAGVAAAQEGDYETTDGKTEPRYEKGEFEELLVETNYENSEGETENPVMYGEVIRPVGDDGERLTDVPVIFTYSPYNDIRSPQSDLSGSIADDGVADFFVPRGYARASFDVVGTRNSEGCYDYGGIRERKTGAGIVDFLGGESDNAGRQLEWPSGEVGMIGASYDGTTQLAAAVEDPDHLTTIVPQVAIDRWYDYAFGGGIRYFLNNQYPTDEGFDTPLAFDFGFGLLPPANVDDPAQFAGAIEDRFRPCDAIQHTERAYETDPVYDEFWKERDYRRRAGEVSASVYIEGGWLDHNVKHWDSTKFYNALPDEHPKKLVMGQWNHTSNQFPDAQDVRHAWFDRWLLGLDTGVMDLPAVDTQLNTQRGTSERHQESQWPPRGTVERAVRLVAAPSEGCAGSELVLKGDEPVYTDAKPPVTEEEMFANGTSTRDAYLKFLSAPLDEPVRISGMPVLDLLATSTADSNHFTPVLYDRSPDGSTTVVTRGFLNARNRNGLGVSEPVPTDEPYRAPVRLWDVDWLLREDHRLGVVIAADNRDWALGDPDGGATTELSLASDPGAGGSVLRVPHSRGVDALGTAARELDVTGNGRSATDVDCDGAYEDVNGDTRADVVDAQALFAGRDDPTVRDNASAFDFNGDGTADVVDVQRLFVENT
jgi:X-Pro dipeptidyl-peptidase